jgi:hypothetical protein
VRVQKKSSSKVYAQLVRLTIQERNMTRALITDDEDRHIRNDVRTIKALK